MKPARDSRRIHISGEAKVLGVLGSPRRGGNSEKLLDKALEGARSSGALCEKAALGDLAFKGCIECGGCDDTGVCTLADDMTALYKKIEDADAIIVASPIFFASLPSQLKAFVDRFQSHWVAKYRLKKTGSGKKKKGVFLCDSGWDKKEFFENARYIVKTLFVTLDIEYSGELYVGGMDKPGAEEKKALAMDKAFELGKSLV